MYLSRHVVSGFFGSLITLATVGCGKSDLTLPGPSTPDATPAAITIFGGDNQTAAPGSPLPAPIVVKVVDSQGNPLAGQAVTFAPASGGAGAQVTPPTATTDGSGLAGATWVLGTAATTQEAVAQVVGGNQLQVRFSATARPGTPSAPILVVRTQPSSSAVAGAVFGRQPVIQLRNAEGNDLTQSGVPVTAAVISGTGTLAGTTTLVTNSQGRAEFSDLRIDGGSGAHVLIFAAAGYTSVTSDPIDVSQPAGNPPPGGNQNPTAASDEYNTIEGSNHTLEVSAADGVLQNDRDPEGGTLTASIESDPSHGHASLDPDGSFRYTPERDFFGDDQFTYRATDPSWNSSTATVTIHVAPVNDSPRFNIRVGRVTESDGDSRTVERFIEDISPGADNESDQALTFVIVGNSDPGLFASGPTITRDGHGSTATLSFTAAEDVDGEAEITVVLRDNGGTANGGGDTSPPQTFRIRIR
jgi:VCBS repeat-containing protein